MDYLLDCMLDQSDAAEKAAEKLYGWEKADKGEAFVGFFGDIVLARVEDEFGFANRKASVSEAEGVREFWRINKMI